MKRLLIALSVAAGIVASSRVVCAQASLSIVHTFDTGYTVKGLIEGRDGTVYATASYPCCRFPLPAGAVFSITRDGRRTLLHEFPRTEGFPNTLTFGTDGNLYGTTHATASMAFKMTTTGIVTPLHTFSSAEGRNPSSLIQGLDGNFYGAASVEGPLGRGTVFKMTPGGDVTVLHAFAGGVDDGANPDARVVQANDGTIYGTTTLGGASDVGTVFKLAADGLFSILKSAPSNGPTGGLLIPGVTLASDGNLYGIMPRSSPQDTEVFRVTPQGNYTTLGTFPHCCEGPAVAPPIEASDGNLYGLVTTDQVSRSNYVYRITPSGRFEALTISGVIGNSFAPPLLQSTDGSFYGIVLNPNSAMFRLTVAMPALMTIDVPVPNQIAAEPFLFGGWALDLGPSSAPGPGIDALHVWAFPVAGGTPTFVCAARYGVDRPDVAAVYGARFEHSGYDLEVRGLAPGSYRLDAFAHRLASGKFDLVRSVTVTIPAPQPHVEIDVPGQNGAVGPSFVVAGWSLDPAASLGTGVETVHVWAYPYPGSGTPPIFLGAAAYGGSRPDVGALFGQRFTNSGYSLTVTGLEAGFYRLAVFALSTATNLFAPPQLRDVTVRADNPVMSLDAPMNRAILHPPFAIWGWAADLDAQQGTGMGPIHVWAFPVAGGPGIFLGAAHDGESRPDVGAIYGSQFTPSGYSMLVQTLPKGQWAIMVFPYSQVRRTFNMFRSATITIE